MPYRTRVRSRGEHSCPKPRVCVEATANSPVSPAACSHPTPRAPDPLSPSSILLCPSDPAGDSRSPQSTHPRGAARGGRGRGPLRQVWAPRGRARLPCLLRRPAECKPAVQQRRRAGSAPPILLPFASPALPPRPRPRAAQPARPPARPPSPPLPLAACLQPASPCHSEILDPPVPRRLVSAAFHHQQVPRLDAPVPGPMDRSHQRLLHPPALDNSTTRPPSSMGLHCLESAEAMLQHGRSLPAFQSSSIPGA